jgi:hypothetical protein
VARRLQLCSKLRHDLIAERRRVLAWLLFATHMLAYAVHGTSRGVALALALTFDLFLVTARCAAL